MTYQVRKIGSSFNRCGETASTWDNLIKEFETNEEAEAYAKDRNNGAMYGSFVVKEVSMNIYEMNKQELIDNKIALPIMWASTADVNHDNDIEMNDYIDCTDTLTLMVLKCPIDIGFDFVMVTDPDKEYTQRTGWMIASDVEIWNEEIKEK